MYSQTVPVPSILISPNVSITSLPLKSSTASSPFWFTKSSWKTYSKDEIQVEKYSPIKKSSLAIRISSPAETEIELKVISMPSVPPPLLATPTPYVLKSLISAKTLRWIALPAVVPKLKSITPAISSASPVQEPSSHVAREL